jgi:transposase
MSGSYRGSGSASYHPKVLLGLLVYGYATGVFSSRKLERATYDSVAFRFIAANDHLKANAQHSSGRSRYAGGVSAALSR